MTYIGLSLGPVLGGWITQLWGWPVTFFVAVPFGLAGLALGIWSVPSVVPESSKPIDVKGFFLFIVGMAAAVLLLNSNAITQHRLLILSVLLICCVIAAWTFIRVERSQPDPMLDLGLFRKRNFGFGTFGAAINYTCFFLTLFLMPFYFDHVLHFSTAATGTYLCITPVFMTICAPIAGTFSDRTGPRLLTTAGMSFSTLGLVLFAIMAKLTSVSMVHTALIAGLVFAGLGTGTFAAPNNSAILGAAPRPKQGVASGTLATFRYIGMMAGITIGGSLFDLLLGFFAHRGAGSTPSFLDAFSLVMWVGALFGAVGIACTLSMTSANRQ